MKQVIRQCYIGLLRLLACFSRLELLFFGVLCGIWIGYYWAT